MAEFNSVGNAMNFAKRFKAFECGVCHQPYQVEGDLQPRILDCGHTFCTRCMGEVSQVGNIQCPACMRKTQVEFGTQSLRINYAILEILEKQDNYTPKPRVPLCEACRMAEAQVYCEHCGPDGFRLCLRCSNVEHDRPSPIAKLHNPTSLGVTTEYEARPVCAAHNNPLEFYCVSEKSLKCVICKQESGISESDVVAIPEAVSSHKDRLRSQLRHLQAYQFTIRGAMEQVKCILTDLRPSADRAMDCIRIECRALEAALQKRQAALLSMVETEEKNRTARLQYQQEHLAVAATRISKCIDFANVLLQKDTSEFLRNSDSVINKLDETLRDEDKGLHKPLANTGLPVYLDTTFIQLVENFGVVGGGPIPKNIEAVHIKGSLYIQWDPPEMKVLQYEIERELVFDEKHCLKEEDAQVTLYDGSLVSVRIIGLAPGCTYRFRIRSQNAAGWGMWSHTFSATYSNFPFEFTYCGEIVESVIPNTGYYRFESFGAKADDGEMRLGGAGAVICATFLLNANDYLDILCGGMSQKRGCCSGGAGGTFVSINGRRNPLIIAGGGGGTRGYEEDDPDGQPGNMEEEGGGSIGKECAMGGAAGGCGKDAIFRNSSFGYGGAGYNTNATTSFSFVSGGESGECGGFGGGGAIGSFGGGGGGGYSGGGGGRGAGGGGCFVRQDGMEVIKKIGHNGHGMLRVTRVDKPKEAELIVPPLLLDPQHTDTLTYMDTNPLPSSIHNHSESISTMPINLPTTIANLSLIDQSSLSNENLSK